MMKLTKNILYRILTGLVFALVGFSSSMALAGSEFDTLSSQIGVFVEHPSETFLNEHLHAVKLMLSFYKYRSNRPAWFDETGALSSLGDWLLVFIKSSNENGLRPEDYHWTQLQRLAFTPSLSPANRNLALELLLSDALFTLTDHLFEGAVDPRSVNPDWDIRHRKLNLVRAIEKAFDTGTVSEFLASLEPRNDRYQKLKSGLASYQLMEKFPRVEGTAALHLGHRGVRVVQLKRRLAKEGYLDASHVDGVAFDEEVRRSVIAFQETHSIFPSGVVDRRTLEELNVPLATRIRELQVNLERLRWMPRNLGNSYVLVDITGYQLTLYRFEKPQLTMRAIVGDDRGRTPIMNAKIQSVDLNPSWKIPKRIVIEEIVPKLVQDPTYLKKRGIKVTATVSGGRAELDTESIDWSQYKGEESFFFFEAPSGPTNPLGMVKFIFPNDLDVYVHGTPDPSLFGQEKRSLSHGCVRIENPVALASQLLKGAGNTWSEARLRESIRAGKLLSLDLPTATPIYLVYRTAWVDEKSRVQFRPDIYNWDETLWQALFGKKQPDIASVTPTAAQKTIRPILAKSSPIKRRQ
jgi:L,D-transpeptidase YcbB